MQFYVTSAIGQEDLLMGVEWERFGVYKDSHEGVPYLGEKGYLKVLKYLHQEKGWEIEDADGEYIFTLKRGDSRTTVEGDGKPEISASPHHSLHDVADEIMQHSGEIEEISQKLDIEWIAVGLQPFLRHDQIPLVPKKRYEMWDRIFPDHQDWMHTYMKALSGIHLNFDYVSEKDLICKAQALFRLAPILAAMFANSPFVEGKPGKCLGMRRGKMFQGGFGQEKMMNGILDKDFSLKKWIDWYVDLPVVIFPFDQERAVPKNFTFRKWMTEGYEGKFPTFFDFDQHLKTRWTDIRFRPSYMELRVIDTLPFPLLMSATAFIKGLLFVPDGCKEIADITQGWTEQTITKLHREGCDKGMKAETHGVSILEIARHLFEISQKNLERFHIMNTKGQAEDIYLEPLQRLLQKGISPAEDLLEFSKGDPHKTVEWMKKEF